MKLYCTKCKDGKPKRTVYSSLDGTMWLCEKHRDKEIIDELSTYIITD